MVLADFNPKVAGRRKIILLNFFKLFERENLNFFSIDQKEMLRNVGFKRIRIFLVLGSFFQIILAYK